MKIFLRLNFVFGFICCFPFLSVQALEQCSAVFPGGIQSHSPTGIIEMGYMSRVYGSGPKLAAPTVTHTHSWADQVGLCDGVTCSATGTHSSFSEPKFLTGSKVPSSFQVGTAGDGELLTSSGKVLDKSSGDYGAVSVSQGSTLRFTSAGGSYLMQSVNTKYQAVLEFAPGDYWVNGDFNLDEQTVVRSGGDASGVVRIYVAKSFKAKFVSFSGFLPGSIEFYVKGDVTVGENFKFPGSIHSSGKVELGTNAMVASGVFAREFPKANSGLIIYPKVADDNYMGALKPDYNSTFELAPGNYWVDGGLVASVATKIRKLPGRGVVRLFVRGDVVLQHAASFEGFAVGELLIYSTGNITFSSQKDIPAFVYAAGDIRINFSGGARYKGGISGRNVYVGQGSIVEYQNPVDLDPLCGVVMVHHYELHYASSALTCQSHPIVLKSCADDACDQTYQGASTVTLSPAGWVGSSTVSFIGSKELSLAIRSPGSVTLGIANPSPVASGSPALRCRINGVLSNQCALTFADSGLLVSVPPLIAGKPDTLTISAVKSDKSQACIPAFANVTRPVQLWGRYNDPGPTEQRGNKLIQVGGQSVDSTPVTLNLAFNANGQAQSSVRYDDAGKMQLDARYQGDASRGDAGLVMEGNTQFVSRPYGLHISHDASCNGATVADCAKLVAAGDPFPLRIRAVAWARDNQPRTASELAGNPTTPSFRLAGITLGSSVVAPADGAAGSFSPGSYSHALGERTEVLQAQQSEVGIFKLIATPPPYFGHDIGSSEALVGRFVPAYLEVSGLADMNSCDGISYQGEEVAYRNAPRLTIQARNRQKQPTWNYYQGEMWGMGTPAASYWTQQDERALGSRLVLLPEAPAPTPAFVLQDWVAGSDGRELRWSGQGWRYEQGSLLPTADDLPFSIEQRFLGRDLRVAERDGVPSRISGSADDLPDGEALKLKFDGSEIRLGRLRIDNASGSEHMPLALPWVLESWQAPGVFRVSSGDSCSADEFNRITLTEYSAPLGEGDTEGDLLKSGASGKIELTAPRDGKTGSVRVGIESLPKWLQFDWDGDGVPDDASGLATFGIYQGPQPLIFRRELYR